VIELATGGDLFERIVNKGFLPEIESVKILQMLLSGLDYLHHQGVVHRDMKPENVLVLSVIGLLMQFYQHRRINQSPF